MATIKCFQSMDDKGHPSAPADALRMLPPYEHVQVAWEGEGEEVEFSRELLESAPALIESMPWPMKLVRDDELGNTSIYRRVTA